MRLLRVLSGSLKHRWVDYYYISIFRSLPMCTILLIISFAHVLHSQIGKVRLDDSPMATTKTPALAGVTFSICSFFLVPCMCAILLIITFSHFLHRQRRFPNPDWIPQFEPDTETRFASACIDTIIPSNGIQNVYVKVSPAFRRSHKISRPHINCPFLLKYLIQEPASSLATIIMSQICSVSSSFSSSSFLSSYSRKSSLNKKLRFGSVEIHDIPMELGNHPPTEGGAPVTLGWQPESIRVTHIDVYELCKGDEPRPIHEWKLSVSDRTAILLRAGYPLIDIKEASERAEETMKEREATLRGQSFESLHLAKERAGRKLKNLSSFKNLSSSPSSKRTVSGAAAERAEETIKEGEVTLRGQSFESLHLAKERAGRKLKKSSSFKNVSSSPSSKQRTFSGVAA
jgi:hypothetical protein